MKLPIYSKPYNPTFRSEREARKSWKQLCESIGYEEREMPLFPLDRRRVCSWLYCPHQEHKHG